MRIIDNVEDENLIRTISSVSISPPQKKRKKEKKQCLEIYKSTLKKTVCVCIYIYIEFSIMRKLDF